MKPEEILIELDRAALWVSEKTGTSHRVMERVIKEFRALLSEGLATGSKGSKKFQEPLKLSQQEVNRLGNQLVIGGVNSYQTWLHRDRLNTLIQKLKKTRVLDQKTPYFRIPVQIQRRLITHIERECWKCLPLIHAIRRALAEFNTLPSSTLEEKESDYVCSFLASTVLFGEMAFPRLESSILRLRWKDVSLSPPYIELPCQPEQKEEFSAFYRYPLPAPASNYLLRYILYIFKQREHIHRRGFGRPDSLLFEPVLRRRKPLHQIFSNWLFRWKKALDMEKNTPLTLEDFRDAVVGISPVAMSSGMSDPSYPPFLIALHCRAIMGDSYGVSPMNTKSRTGSRKRGKVARTSWTETIKENTILRDAFSDIDKVLKKLNRQSPLGERRRAEKEIRSITLSFKKRLTDSDFVNLSLCVDWLSELLNTPKGRSLKKVTNYFPSVKKLLHAVSGMKPFCEMNREDQHPAIQKVLQTVSSRNIQKEIKSFTDFLEATCNDSYVRPDWRSKELQKMDAWYTKPFIDEPLVQKAVAMCKDFYCRYAESLKNPVKRELQREAALHKAHTISHMVNLGFYAGVRASEFTHLRIENVIYDCGVTLCIRQSKTLNGIRNLPLSLIVPDSYLASFVEHYKKRKIEALEGNRLLFPALDNEIHDASHMGSEVSRLFAAVGVSDMRYHHLRHAFASWFLLRWFAAFYPQYMPADMPFMKMELLQSQYLARLRSLILGGSAKKGQENFTYALPVLARLIGHGGPLVTLQKYIHTGDWLFYLLSRQRGEKSITVNSTQAGSYLQRSHPSLPARLKGKKKKVLTCSELLDFQKHALPADVRKKIRI